ncbi:MAG: FAD-binding oxidoreductase [Alphaproteobacteria bacterium]
MNATPVTPPPHIESYYSATVKRETAYPSLSGEVACDVCVIGAGYTGLSSALHLAERGYRVVVLEGARVGWGASGRNGGQIITGFSGELTPVEAKLGHEDAVRLWRLAVEAKDLLSELVDRHRIDCHLTPGYVFAACHGRHLREMAETIAVWGSYGYDKLEMLDREAVRRQIASERYVGGLYDHGGGHLHPLNYTLGLARAAEGAGAVLHEGSRVLRIDRGGRGGTHACRTAEGVVRCRHVVLAGNAYLGALVPEIRTRIMPVATYMIATEPLGRERARALLPGDIAFADFNQVVDYCRLTRDHRLLFGGGARYWLGDPHDLKEWLRRRMIRVFPQLEDVRIDFAWGGHVAITLNRLPNLGVIDDSLWYAHGYSGQGVAFATMAGKLICEAVSGSPERFRLCARIPHRPFPGGPARAPLLALAMLYHKLRDMM